MPRISFDPVNTRRETVDRKVETIQVKVPSATTEGATYWVTIEASCTCNGWLYRRACHHVKDVLDGVAIT
jgi:hypothetical protein